MRTNPKNELYVSQASHLVINVKNQRHIANCQFNFRTFCLLIGCDAH